MGSADRRSGEAAAYRKLYKTAMWLRLRNAHIKANPLCVMCQEHGRTSPASVVDHRTPHRGNLSLFWDPANLQSLCAPHHDGAKQSEDRRGYSKAVGHDGWPTDPRHPSNRKA